MGCSQLMMVDPGSFFTEEQQRMDAIMQTFQDETQYFLGIKFIDEKPLLSNTEERFISEFQPMTNRQTRSHQTFF